MLSLSRGPQKLFPLRGLVTKGDTWVWVYGWEQDGKAAAGIASRPAWLCGPNTGREHCRCSRLGLFNSWFGGLPRALHVSLF